MSTETYGLQSQNTQKVRNSIKIEEKKENNDPRPYMETIK